MKVSNFIEKRECPRYDLRIPLSYKKIEAKSREFKGSLLKNISLGGVRLSVYELLPQNLKLALEIPLRPGLKPIEAHSRVAWVRSLSYGEQYDIGVEFLKVSKEDNEQLAKFIKPRM